MGRDRRRDSRVPLHRVEFHILLSLGALTRAARIGGLLTKGAK